VETAIWKLEAGAGSMGSEDPLGLWKESSIGDGRAMEKLKCGKLKASPGLTARSLGDLDDGPLLAVAATWGCSARSGMAASEPGRMRRGFGGDRGSVNFQE